MRRKAVRRPARQAPDILPPLRHFSCRGERVAACQQAASMLPRCHAAVGPVATVVVAHVPLPCRERHSTSNRPPSSEARPTGSSHRPRTPRCPPTTSVPSVPSALPPSFSALCEVLPQRARGSPGRAASCQHLSVAPEPLPPPPHQAPTSDVLPRAMLQPRRRPLASSRGPIARVPQPSSVRATLDAVDAVVRRQHRTSCQRPRRLRMGPEGSRPAVCHFDGHHRRALKTRRGPILSYTARSPITFTLRRRPEAAEAREVAHGEPNLPNPTKCLDFSQLTPPDSPVLYSTDQPFVFDLLILNTQVSASSIVDYLSVSLDPLNPLRCKPPPI
jgi:hypothetical protein